MLLLPCFNSFNGTGNMQGSSHVFLCIQQVRVSVVFSLELFFVPSAVFEFFFDVLNSLLSSVQYFEFSLFLYIKMLDILQSIISFLFRD
jgi:hypothetical protein